MVDEEEPGDAAAQDVELANEDDGGHRDRIYLIETPSAEDLLLGRHEGDALYRVLRLADVDVVYFMAVNSEMFDKAFKEIELQILNQADIRTAMPFIHISGHGSDVGIELTDGDVVFWEKLTQLMQQLSDQIGAVRLPPPLPQEVPRVVLCLSSCGVFDHYKEAVAKPPPFQALVGPVRDVGWCEALIAYATFYFQINVLNRSLLTGRISMNIASGAILGEGENYKVWNYYQEG